MTLPGLESAREIVRWAYNSESEKGKVAMFDLAAENKYVVALLTDIRKKGIAPLDEIKKNIEPLVIRERKAQMLMDKINAAMNSTKEIVALAAKLNTKVDSLNNLSFYSYNLPMYGPEPDVIGELFTLKKGTLCPPIKGANGVFVAIIDNINKPQNQGDFNMMRMQLGNEYSSKVTNTLFNALEECTKIEDNRLLYY